MNAIAFADPAHTRREPSFFTMTEHRLWLLYDLARFSHSEICETLTDWPWDRVKQKLDGWRLRRTHDRGVSAEIFVEHRLADRLSLPLDEETRRLLAGSREALRSWVSARIAEGPHGWNRLDALPGPDEVDAWVKAWEREVG